MKKDGKYKSTFGYLASFVQRVNVWQEGTGEKSERYQSKARDSEHSAEWHNCQKINASQRTRSQVKCAAIDSINREKVQHVVCPNERPGVNRVMAFLQRLA